MNKKTRIVHEKVQKESNKKTVACEAECGFNESTPVLPAPGELRVVTYKFQNFCFTTHFFNRSQRWINLSQGELFFVVETFDEFQDGRCFRLCKVLTALGVGYASENRVLTRSRTVNNASSQR